MSSGKGDMLQASIHKSKWLCTVGVIFSLTILGIFKYYNFFGETICRLIGKDSSGLWHIVLPVGISFYTFQSMSYLIDVYRGKLEARDSFVQVSLYISFFPQLVAGPIVRSTDFLPQLDYDHKVNIENIRVGLNIFIGGAIKKAVIADRMAVCVDAVYGAFRAYDAPSIICAMISYSIQIYCDFSGYSDMAIGVAKCFGYDLCQNFNCPYLSQSPTEFWKRWHISLSSWLQDYVYIPLGGSRKGEFRRYINLLITMLLGGLWHGANWTFVIWGGLHGVALVLHKLWMNMGKKLARKTGVIYKTLVTILTFIFVSICWVFFRSETLLDALEILGRVVRWSDGVHYIYSYTLIFGIAMVVYHLFIAIFRGGQGKYFITNTNIFIGKVLLFLEIWFLIIMAYPGDTAFVYFQF